MEKIVYVIIFVFIFFNCSNPMSDTISNPISNANDLKKEEGKDVLVSGKLLPSDVMKRTPVRLQLQDSSFVYIGAFENSSGLYFSQLEKYNNKNVIINGKVFFDEIPEQYKIISRLSGPYLVDIKEIKAKE